MRTWPFNGEREREEIGLWDALRNTHAGVNIQGEALRGLPNPPDLMKRSLRKKNQNKTKRKSSYFSLCRKANPDVNSDTVLAGEETEGRRGRCEAGPRGELRTKVFHSSGA